MTLAATVQSTQFRLARHYFEKIKRGNAAIQRRGVSSAFWLNQVDLDWQQIERWQQWAVSGMKHDPARARLCVSIALENYYLLRARLPNAVYLHWYEQALEAARSWNDSYSLCRLLYRLAESYSSMTEDLASAERYAQELAELARADGDLSNLGRALSVLGAVESTRGNYDQAETILKEALEHLENCNASEIEKAKVRLWMGRIAVFRGNYALGYTEHMFYLYAYEAIKDELAVAGILPSISGICLYLGNKAEAVQHATNAVDYGRRLGLRRQLPVSLICLAHAEKAMGQLDEARLHYAEALNTGKSLVNPSSVINTYYGWAQACFLAGDAEQALERLEEGLALAHQHRFPFRICEVACDKAMIHATRHELKAAADCLSEAIKQAQHLGTARYWVMVTSAIAVVAEQSGYYQAAAGWAGRVLGRPELIDVMGLFAKSCQNLEAELGRNLYHKLTDAGREQTPDEFANDALNWLDRMAAQVQVT
ncbi:MAG: tetratricopeptide repeat protein [Anaerolineae bacterium]